MSNTLPDEKFNAIVDSICYWLGYQLKIGRDQLVHEASLRYPIADVITAKGIAIRRVVLEKVIPVFMSKRFDLVIFNKKVKEPSSEKDDSNLQEAYEFKLAKSETTNEFGDEHQRVFDDIVRLAYYNLWNKKDCYFLMCGKYDEFKAYFVGQTSVVKNQNKKNTVPVRQNKLSLPGNLSTDENWKADGLYKDWFGFKIGEEKRKVFKITDHPTWGLVNFKASYKIRDNTVNTFSNEIEVKTKCLALTPQGLENAKTHAAGIWKIEGLR